MENTFKKLSDTLLKYTIKELLLKEVEKTIDSQLDFLLECIKKNDKD